MVVQVYIPPEHEVPLSCAQVCLIVKLSGSPLLNAHMIDWLRIQDNIMLAWVKAFMKILGGSQPAWSLHTS